ncbi:MAG: Stp1/IreP family PP2C-type Ser/Thr phosphatase [Bacillota bacterium]
MRFGACTDPGLLRPNNQDAYGHRGPLFLVADGLGGHRAGEVASRIAVEEILAAMEGREPLVELRAGFLAANEAIRAYAMANPECYGMGTTVAALLFLDGHACIAHIGDSRVYLYRSRRLVLLTRDHSLVEELVRQGSLSEDEARNHPQRSVLTRALGTTETPQVEYAELELEKGDVFLLCTDGLTGELEEKEIESVLATDGHPQAKAERLVEMAKRHGGADNITVVVVDDVV